MKKKRAVPGWVLERETYFLRPIYVKKLGPPSRPWAPAHLVENTNFKREGMAIKNFFTGSCRDTFILS